MVGTAPVSTGSSAESAASTAADACDMLIKSRREMIFWGEEEGKATKSVKEKRKEAEVPERQGENRKCNFQTF